MIRDQGSDQDHEPLISVLVPVYNVEKYLNKCIESIINQTYKNLEIILIDDGSTDSSPKICDEYAQKDSRIKVIHKQNGGAASARNLGIDISSGNLLGFIDGDDFISPFMYGTLFELMRLNKADVGICDISITDKKGNEFTNSPDRDKNKIEILTRNEAFLYIDKFLCFQSSATKLYQRKIFENLRFPEGYTNEDQFIIHHVLALCDRVIFIHEKFYFYVQHNSSICGNLRRNIKTERDIKDFMHAINDRYKFFLNMNLHNVAHNALVRKYSYILTKLDNKNYFTYKTELDHNISILIKELSFSGHFKDKLRLIKIVIKFLKMILIQYMNVL